MHVDSYRWSFADTSCCLTFPTPDNDGVVCSLTFDLQEAVKPLSVCHKALAQPCLFFESTFSKRHPSSRFSGISMHSHSFIRWRWANQVSSGAGLASMNIKKHIECVLSCVSCFYKLWPRVRVCEFALCICCCSVTHLVTSLWRLTQFKNALLQLHFALFNNQQANNWADESSGYCFTCWMTVKQKWVSYL